MTVSEGYIFFLTKETSEFSFCTEAIRDLHRRILPEGRANIIVFPVCDRKVPGKNR